jgi:hypothetical protein
MINKPMVRLSVKRRALARKQVDKFIRRVASAHKAGKKKRCAYLASQYLQSFDARLVATWRAYRKLNRHRRPDRKLLPSIAASLSPWAGTKETAVVNMKEKGSNGGYRLPMDFGIENRALQYLLVPLLGATADLHPEQYLMRGGVPAAIDRVKELLLDGYVWTVESDIADCFPSFEGGNIHNFLPLPEKVIRHVVMADDLSIVPGNKLISLFGPAEGDEGDPVMLARFLADARRGIPHGSAAASLIVEMLLAGPLKTLPTNIGVVPSYADNMLIMARCEKDAVTMKETLWLALKGHSVGQLQPKERSKSGPGEPVAILGHRLQLKGHDVKITPSPENDNKFHQHVTRGLKYLNKTSHPTSARQRRARELRGYVGSWTANFCRCEGMAERKTLWLAKIDAAIGAIGH